MQRLTWGAKRKTLYRLAGGFGDSPQIEAKRPLSNATFFGTTVAVHAAFKTLSVLGLQTAQVLQNPVSSGGSAHQSPSKPCQFWDSITNQLRRKGKKIRTSRNLMGNTSFPHSAYRFGMVDVGTYDAVRPREGPVGLGRVRAQPTFLRSRPDSPALQVCPKEKGRRPTLCRQPDRDATCFARVLRAADPTRLQSHGKRLADCCRCDRKALEYIQKRNVVFVLGPIFSPDRPVSLRVTTLYGHTQM